MPDSTDHMLPEQEFHSRSKWGQSAPIGEYAQICDCGILNKCNEISGPKLLYGWSREQKQPRYSIGSTISYFPRNVIYP